MSGDATKTSVWADADVYVDFTQAAAEPTNTTTAYDAAWKVAGLLDGGEGFEEERDEDTSEHYAWGGILIKKTRSKHKRTIKFVALEDNDTTFRLVNPGSTRGTPDGVTGDITSTVKVPKYEPFSISFETRDGSTKRKRRTVKHAEIEEIGTLKDSEEDATAREITVVLFPEADGTLYTEISHP